MVCRSPLQVSAVRRSALLVLVTAAALAAAAGAVYGGHAAVTSAALLAVLGGATLALGHAVAARRSRLGSLRRQFGFAVAIAVGQVLVAAGAGALLMFVSPHDAFFIVLIAMLASVVGARTAQLFAGGVMADIDGLRATLAAVGDGAREPAATTSADDELADLAAAANEAIVKLAASEKARGELVAAVSHDLRTPITSLRLVAEAIKDDIVDDQTQRRYLKEMTTHITSLSALTDDLFELSRLRAGDVAWTMQRVRLDALLGETVDAMRVQAAAKQVHVRADVPADIAPARAHPEKLQRVLFNLIQNAIRHTPADGSVTVSAEAADDHLEIEVADTGQGIAAAERDRVFDPFFRGGGDASRTGGGAGLGLAISRAIVEAHGGRIWLEESALGTRVRLSLPVAGGRAARRPS